MQNFSAQDITYANYKEKLDIILKNCKQNELKNYQKRSVSRSNSREKSLNSKSKAATAPKQTLNTSNGGGQQQGSKKNLVRNSKNLQINTASCEKKQSQQSHSKQVKGGNSTCTNGNKISQNILPASLSGTQSVQNKIAGRRMNNPQSCKSQSNQIQQNSVSINNQNQQQNNTLNVNLTGEQHHNFSSFFSSQSTKNNINNNLLLNNSVQGVGANGGQGGQKQNSNREKINLFLQHLQNNESPMKQILQIQDKLQSYHQNNNNINMLQHSVNLSNCQNNGIQNQMNQDMSQRQNLNSSVNSHTLNLNNSYSLIPPTNNQINNQANNLTNQLQQRQRQRVNSNDCVFNVNSINPLQSYQFDAYTAHSPTTSSHQQSIQFQSNSEQNSTLSKLPQQQIGAAVAQVNLKLNLQGKSLKTAQSPHYNPFPHKKNVFSMHSSASSADPQKCVLNQLDDQFTPSSSIAPKNKFIDLSGANIQISDIALDKKMNINELSEVTPQQHLQFLKASLQQQQLIKESFHSHSYLNQSDNFEMMSSNHEQLLVASMPVDCNIGSCNQDEEYLRTPKQNVYGGTNSTRQSIQLPYQHTPITHNNQPKQKQEHQDNRIRSKSFADKESQMIHHISIQNQSSSNELQNKIFQKRRALTIADDSYTVLQNEDYQTNKQEQQEQQEEDSIIVNKPQFQQKYQQINRKVEIPKIKYFDQMIEEKNQQMDFEIPAHVYNETFQGEEYTSSQATSELRSEIHESRIDSLNQTQNLDNPNIGNSDMINSLQQTLKQNPMQGYRNIMKAMEISGKDGDAEIKALKITIRKLQYRDAILRQKIASMGIVQTEQASTIQKLDAENNELIVQVNAYAEQHDIYENQISQLQSEMQEFQEQVNGLHQNNSSHVENQLRQQIIQFEDIVQDMRNQLVLEEEQNQVLQQKNQIINEQNQSMRQQIQELMKQNQEFREQNQELRQQRNKNENLEEELKNDIHQHEEEIQRQQYEFLEKLAEFQEENIRLNTLLSEKSQQKQEILSTEEKGILNKQIRDLNSENEKLYEQITSLLKENEQYKQQKEVVHNVNDLSLKSLQLLDDNSKLIDENRTLQASVQILTKDNRQLKEGMIAIQQKQESSNSLKSSPTNQVDQQRQKQLIEDSQNVIRELKTANQDLQSNLQNLEIKNRELSSHCSILEQNLSNSRDEIKKLNVLNYNSQARNENVCNSPLQEKISILEKEIQDEKEKTQSLEKKIIQLSQKNSLNQSVQSKQENASEEVTRIRIENDELKRELDEQQRERDCLEEVLKNYLLQRELEKLKLSGDQKILNDQEQDDEIAAVFQSEIKMRPLLNSQEIRNMDLNGQLLQHLSNSKMMEKQGYGADYCHMYKRNSNCTITNANNTNYQISITNSSQLSLLQDDHHDTIHDNFNNNDNNFNNGNNTYNDNNNYNDDNTGMRINNEDIEDDLQLVSGQFQQFHNGDVDNSHLNYITSIQTNNNNNTTNNNYNTNNNNNNNTIHSNNILKKSNASSSSHFLREIDSNIQILINNNSNNTLFNNIQHLLNTSSSSNLLSKESTPILPQQQQQQQLIPSSSSANNLPQNNQQTLAHQNSLHQLNLSHDNPCMKQAYPNQKCKENENSMNSQTLAQQLQQQNLLQTRQSQQTYSDKFNLQFPSHTQKNVSQQFQTNQHQQLVNNKENQFVKHSLGKTLMTNPNSIALNINK